MLIITNSNDIQVPSVIVYCIDCILLTTVRVFLVTTRSDCFFLSLHLRCSPMTPDYLIICKIILSYIAPGIGHNTCWENTKTCWDLKVQVIKKLLPLVMMRRQGQQHSTFSLSCQIIPKINGILMSERPMPL